MGVQLPQLVLLRGIRVGRIGRVDEGEDVEGQETGVADLLVGDVVGGGPPWHATQLCGTTELTTPAGGLLQLVRVWLAVLSSSAKFCRFPVTPL
jgi:hypothetical protein